MIEVKKGQRIVVMGIGRFGGGVGVIRWLAEHGAHVVATDMLSTQELAEPLGEIRDLIEHGSVELRLGGHDINDFASAKLVVANPAVPKPWMNTYLEAARKAHVPVTTEIRLVVERLNRSRVIGVTGSAGKSTTSAMIHHMLAKCGLRTHFGGNIGGSLLAKLEEIRPDDWVVLELSSAMLHWLGEGVGYPEARGWSPHVAVLTNILPNHIDWHGSFEHYRESKRNIIRYQVGPDVDSFVYWHDPLDIESATWASGISSEPWHASDKCPELTSLNLKIPGGHNLKNARLAVLACALATGDARVSRNHWENLQDTLAASLTSFGGLPHRLQLVAEFDDKRFYNDSKSTTPDATVLAVEAFDNPSRIHLIVGGYDKGSDLTAIGALALRVAGLYAIGATAKDIVMKAKAAMERAAAGAQKGHVEVCEELERAVERAMNRMREGDVLLLSPGCASWDQFTNYEYRGRKFEELVSAQRTASAWDRSASPHG